MINQLLTTIQEKYPFVKIDAFEAKNRIELQLIEVPDEYKNQGIGSEIIRMLQDYAASVGKPIVLRPEADPGKKKSLERFYKGLGFVDNKGRNIDYSLSSPLAKTMYWRFREWLEQN